MKPSNREQEDHPVPQELQVPAYHTHGSGPRTLLLIHGWCCDSTYWDPLLDSLTQHYRAITLDLAGHGKSTVSHSPWSIQAFARDVVSVLDAADAHDVVLVGHSLGGPVALEAGILAAGRVRAVIGIDCFFDLWHDPSVTGIVDLMRQDFVQWADRWVREAMFIPESPIEVINHVAAAVSSADPGMAIPALADLFAWVTSRGAEAAAALAAPMGLLMAGDPPRETNQFWHDRGDAPSLGTIPLPGVGHFPMLEKPGEFAADLERMIARGFAYPVLNRPG